MAEIKCLNCSSPLDSDVVDKTVFMIRCMNCSEVMTIDNWKAIPYVDGLEQVVEISLESGAVRHVEYTGGN